MLMTGLGFYNLYYDQSLQSFKYKNLFLNKDKNKSDAPLLSIICNVTTHKST